MSDLRLPTRAGRVRLIAAGAVLALAVSALVYRPPVAPQVNVRWSSAVGDQQRAALEARFHLTHGEWRDERTWTYRIADTTRTNVGALVTHPDVEDTHHIDRRSFDVEGAANLLNRLWPAASALLIGLGAATLACLGWIFMIRASSELAHAGVGRLATPITTALYLVISVWFCAPIFEEPLALGQEDWDQHLFFYGQVLKNVIEYGQAPFWSPWYCGGNVMWQNPQVALMSPVFFLATLVPLPLAMKLNIVLHYWLGFMGMHLLITRAIGLTSLPIAIFLATLFTASGAIVLHVAIGHSVFLPVMYLPLMLFWLIRAFQLGRIRDSLLAGSMLALMVWNGGVHVLPMAFVSVGALVGVAAVVTRRWHPLILGGCFIVSGLAYAAPKLLPVSLFVTGERLVDDRKVPHPDWVTPRILPHIYLEPDPPRDRFDGQAWSWHEYGNYVGTFSAVMLTWAVVWAPWYRGTGDRWLGLGLAVATMLCFSLSLGEFAEWAPASLASRVPLLSNFRIPARYTIPSVLLATCTLAWTLRRVGADALARPETRVFVALLCLISSSHLIVVNRGHLRQAFHEPPFDTSFKWMRGPSRLTTDATSSGSPGSPGSPMLRALVQDRLFFRCWEPLQLRRTALPDRPPVFSDGKSRLDVSRFLPNRIEFRVVNGDQPSRVYLNTNWSPGWHTDAGALTVPHDAAPFVTLAAGKSGMFAFWFVPDGLWIGVLVLIAATLVSISVWKVRI